VPWDKQQQQQQQTSCGQHGATPLIAAAARRRCCGCRSAPITRCCTPAALPAIVHDAHREIFKRAEQYVREYRQQVRARLRGPPLASHVCMAASKRAGVSLAAQPAAHSSSHRERQRA
jgi:hypothetical protein